MIVVVDYKKGNLQSVARGLEAAGAQVVVSTAASDILRAQGIVLPGVGAFADAMDTMNATAQAVALRAAVEYGIPFLGICLGLHLLFEGGTEHAEGEPTPGIGLLPGVVDLVQSKAEDGNTYKVPHVGWNTVSFADGAHNECPLFQGIPDESYFYFTHSYCVPENPYTVATTTHAQPFPVAVQKDNIFGVQFHPEKSSDVGAQVLQNFVALTER